MAGEDSDFDNFGKDTLHDLIDSDQDSLVIEPSLQDHKCTKLIYIDIGKINNCRPALEVCMCPVGSKERSKSVLNLTCNDFLEIVRTKYNEYID